MNIAVRDTTLPNLIDRASKVLINARSSAEVLEARDMAAAAYSIAKVSARLAKAKHAHDELVAAAHRAQADALEIEAGAKRRLADEYDAAQERGEVATAGKRSQPERLTDAPPSAADVGLSRKEIHEARIIRDAEKADPGIVRRALDEQLRQGKEPTKAALRRAIKDDEDYDEPDESPSRKRDAFLVFSNEAMLLAKYEGPIDREVVEAAKATASAWSRLVKTMEQRNDGA